MIKKFNEFYNEPEIEDPEIDVEDPIIVPRPKPMPPQIEPDEDDEDDDPLKIDPDIKPVPKLKTEKNIINKLKEVLNEKGMTLEDLYKICTKL